MNLNATNYLLDLEYRSRTERKANQRRLAQQYANNRDYRPLPARLYAALSWWRPNMKRNQNGTQGYSRFSRQV